MSKLLVVFKREYTQVVKRKAFIVGIFLTPALMAAFTIIPALLFQSKSNKSVSLAIIDQSGMEIGNKFEASLKKYKIENSDKPYYIVKNIFTLDTNETKRFQHINDSLSQLIVNKKLKYYLVIKPEAYFIDTNIYLVTNAENFVTLNRFEKNLSNILSTIRLEMSHVNLNVDSILTLTKKLDLKTKDAKGNMIPFTVKYFSAYVFVGIMFGIIFGYGQLVMRSVIEEKNSRVMEVLVSSVSPFQLMLGKITGLGAATLTQIFIWFVIGMGIYFMKSTFDFNPAVDRIIFNPVIIIFFILFLVSGYILYSTIFALIGSVVNSEKEAQNFIFPITILMILPFMIGAYIVQEPNSTISVTLSMIPFLTPTIMMMRVIFIAPTLTSYSLFSGIIGEAMIGFFLIVLSIVIMIWLTSKIFRVGILMYGKRPTLPEIIKWIKY